MARFFNGTSDTITFGPSNGAANNLSAALWVRPTNLTGDQITIQNGTHNTDGWSFKTTHTAGPGLPSLEFGGQPGISFTSPLMADAWQHHAFTMDNTGFIFEYLNAATDPFSGTRTCNAPTGSFTLASDGVGGSFWGGWMAEVAVWNRVLSAAEILTLYKGNLPSSLSSGLVIYYSLGGLPRDLMPQIAA